MKVLKEIFVTFQSLFPDNLDEYIYFAQMDEPHGEERPRTCYWFEMVGDFTVWVIEMMDCIINGHQLEDEGCSGPESGCIDLTCQRCGYSPGKVILY